MGRDVLEERKGRGSTGGRGGVGRTPPAPVVVGDRWLLIGAEGAGAKFLW